MWEVASFRNAGGRDRVAKRQKSDFNLCNLLLNFHENW